MQPSPHGRASWPSSDDNTGFYLAVSLFAAAVGSYFLWDAYHGPISASVMQVFHWEISFLRPFTDRFDLADRQMLRAVPGRVTLAHLYGMARDLGVVLRYPALVVMVPLAAWCALRAAPSRYRRALDLEGLIREQARSFPVLSAFVGRRLRLADPAPGEPRPADRALNPAEWAARYATRPDGTFDAGGAWRTLVRQLGPRWRGPAGASPVVRCMFAAFALHLAERRTDAVALLGKVSAALEGLEADSPGGPERSLPFPDAVLRDADHALRDPAVARPALAVAGRHAFAHTALMGLLNAARSRAGVLAPSQFAWLKLVDRPLWYALHSLGFETEGADRYLHPNPFIEAAGARDHWAAERALGQPLYQPDVERALERVWKAADPSRSQGPRAPSDPATS